jgi:hypothetical protein
VLGETDEFNNAWSPKAWDSEKELGMGIEPISIGEISLKTPFFCNVL